jgi:YidC/Oxa1 family membrane protein insertase
MSLLDPLKHALATVLATTHDALTALGASPDSAVTWVLGVASLVVLVRLLLLPFVVHGVRQAHASARARPHLRGIAERYRGRTDAESLRAHMDERRAVSVEHGVSRLGCLPVLVQLPVWLYGVVIGRYGLVMFH